MAGLLSPIAARQSKPVMKLVQTVQNQIHQTGYCFEQTKAELAVNETALQIWQTRHD